MTAEHPTGTAIVVVVILGVIQAVLLVAALVEIGLWLRGRGAPYDPQDDLGRPSPAIAAVWLALAAGVLLVMQWVLTNLWDG
jgi:hypothetical protein